MDSEVLTLACGSHWQALALPSSPCIVISTAAALAKQLTQLVGEDKSN